MIDVKKISAVLPKIWKQPFDNGVVIPAEKRLCNECSKEKYCGSCNQHVNDSKEFEPDLNLLKWKAPNEFGYMFPYFKK